MNFVHNMLLFLLTLIYYQWYDVRTEVSREENDDKRQKKQ